MFFLPQRKNCQCCQAVSAVFTQSCGTQFKRFWGYHHKNDTSFDYKVFFCIPGFTAETETTLLLSAAFLSFLPTLLALWYPIGSVEELCLVLPRNGTEQQYAWAFSLQSPPPPSTLFSALSFPFFNCGGWGHRGQGSIGGRASLKQWHHLCRTGRQWGTGARSPVCMCKLACAVI